MIEVQHGFRIMKFNGRRYLKTLDRRLGVIIRQAAREWLRAVLKSVPARGGFPVVTGAAKSTLVPLGRVLRVAVPVRPVGRKDRREEGENSSKFKIVDDSVGGNKKYVYSFEWSTDLLHYYINEFYGYIPHAPWNTTEAGEEAFVAYVEDALNRELPDISDHIELE